MKSLNNKEKFKNAIDRNVFTLDELLYFLKLLVNKLNLIGKSEYAKKENISPAGVMSRLKSTNTPYIKIIGRIFIVS